VRRAHLESGETIERALKDQLRQRDRGIERVTDDVFQHAIAFEAAVESGHPCRMYEQQHAQLLRFRPDRMEFRVRELGIGDAAPDRSASQVQLFDGVIELLHGEIGKVKGERRKGNKSFGMRSAKLGELFILDPDHLSRALAVQAVLDGIDAQGFHIDALRIHRSNARARRPFSRAARSPRPRVACRSSSFAKLGLPPLHRTTCERDTRNSTDCIFYELPACAHRSSLTFVTASVRHFIILYFILSSFAAVPPSMAMRSSSLNPGVFMM
jgi:hypothetical protein